MHKFIDDTTLSEIVQKGSDSDMQRALDALIQCSQLNNMNISNILLLSGFMTSRLQEGKELFAYQISTRYLNPRPSYYYFWLLKTNVHHI